MVLALLCVTAANAGTCEIGIGHKASLFGGVDDPDVLVWDNKERLAEYAGGSSDARRFLIPHAILARPGTRIVVRECVANMVHPKFRFTTEDAMKVLIVSGRYRGKFGWVGADDLHGPGIARRADSW